MDRRVWTDRLALHVETPQAFVESGPDPKVPFCEREEMTG